MKARMIALVALSALVVSPAFGAPRKMTSAKSTKQATAPAKEKAAPAKEKAAPAKEKAAPAKEKAAAAKEKISGEQAGARKLVAGLTATQKSRMLALLNEGTSKDLVGIKGISRTRAAAIEKARPFKGIDEVILVSGIGKGTMSEIVSQARSLTTTPRKSSPASSSSRKKKS